MKAETNTCVWPQVLPRGQSEGLSAGIASIGYVSPATLWQYSHSRGTALRGNTGRGSAPATPAALYAITIIMIVTLIVTERKRFMSNRRRNLGINIRVTPAEKKKIERNAKKCKLNVSEYLRQIAMGIEPKELPSEEIIQSIMRLQSEVSLFEKYAQASTSENGIRFYRDVADRLNRIYTETVQLLTRSAEKSEVMINGND